MSFRVKARYYADPDCFGESYVLTSENNEVDLRLPIGSEVKIVVSCSCGKDGIPRTNTSTVSVEHLCDECYAKRIRQGTV